MKVSVMLSAFAAVLTAGIPIATAQTWNGPTGAGESGSWATDSNWVSPANKPNSIGAAAVFNSVGTTNRTITNDAGATGFTVGSISYTSNAGTTQTTSLTTGTAGSKLILDNGGSGVTLATSGTGTGNMTVSVPLTFSDNITVQADQQNTASAALSLNLTATITGSGGFTKNGDGGATFGTGTKTYTGATVINGGRMRISQAAHPSATSSFTINAGGQVDNITAGTYTFGSGPLNLNGSGPTTGQFAPFPGAIRPDTNLAITIANTSVVLQSDTTVHMQGSATGALTFSGAVSGAGKFLIGSIPHDANIGQVILGGTDSYGGGTKVQAGTLVAAAASITAFGTGNVTIDSANLSFGGSAARIQILAGATNSIADAATLSLAGGNAAGVADDGYIDLAAGINETVGGLVLGGTTQTTAGTYGSTASGATFQNDEYFTGTGTITLVLASLPGDFNSDGKVDAGDYVTWRKNNGTNNALANDNGLGVPIGASHYNLWRANFGKPPGSGSGLTNSAVPEPSTIALAGLCVAPLLIRRRRRFGKVQ